MTAGDAVLAARATVAVFPLADRALLEVRGDDRIRFLQGQLTHDVAGLDPAGPRSGCYALLLTAQGRIVADLQVLARPGEFWLETAASRAAVAQARLEKYVIADDVRIAERSAGWVRFAIEGPRAPALLAAAAPGAALDLLPDAGAPLAIAGAEGWVAAFGWSGETALQLFVPVAAAGPAAEALRTAGEPLGAAWGDRDALEVLRVEAGIPRSGAELDEDVLPAEARLVERAVSFTKGCYTGQEVVARMHSRRRVGHLLVGLALPADCALPVAGTPLAHDGAKVGALTSAVFSPSAGAIGLGFVRAAHAEPGTTLGCASGTARVVALPFVALRAGGREP